MKDNMSAKKAILISSYKLGINYTEYTSTPDKTAVEQAQEQMHKEYHDYVSANKGKNGYEDKMSCTYVVLNEDGGIDYCCDWRIIPMSETTHEHRESNVYKKMERGHYVYQYLHPEYGHLYIGRTENLNQRIYTHDNSKDDNIPREYEHLLKESVVMYIELQNKAQEIAVEAYCIDKYKPFLNTSLKYDEDNSILEMKLPKWKLYQRKKEKRKPLYGKYIQLYKGKVVGVYDTIDDIRKIYPYVTDTAMSNCATGRAKSAYGYEWQRLKENHPRFDLVDMSRSGFDVVRKV